METQNHLRDGVDLNYFTVATRDELHALAGRAIAATTKLMGYLQRRARVSKKTRA